MKKPNPKTKQNKLKGINRPITNRDIIRLAEKLEERRTARVKEVRQLLSKGGPLCLKPGEKVSLVIRKGGIEIHSVEVPKADTVEVMYIEGVGRGFALTPEAWEIYLAEHHLLDG